MDDLQKIDLEIQIKAVTEQSLSELRTRHPGKKFDLMIRDFASSIYIKLCDVQFSEVLKQTPEGFVFEKFCLNPPSAKKTMLHINGDRELYEKTVLFLEELRFVPVLEELNKVVGYDFLIPWIRDKDKKGHEEFFKKIQEKYPKLFSHLNYETTIAELTDVLMAAIERKYRSDAINYHIKTKTEHIQTKTGKEVSIEDKLAAVLDWQIKESEMWFSKMYEFMPELSLIGFQRTTVTEIVPLGLKPEDYSGHVGGKTIKICKYFDDLNKEFILSQCNALGKSIEDLDPSTLGELRDLYLHMIVDRRYIFPEAIDQIFEFKEKTTKVNVEHLRNDIIFRSFLFRSFLNESHNLFSKIYQEYNLLPH